MMSLSTTNTRGELCLRIAQTLNGGTNHVKIRIHQEGGRAIRANLLGHQKNRWHEEEAILGDVAGLPQLAEDMLLLGSHAHGDELSVRQVKTAEALDTDLQFHNDWVEGHRGDHLASYVEGLLFGDSHGSGNDMRRRM